MAAAHLPLVCTATLNSLEESLDGERELCLNFVCRYVEMWPGRFDRIYDAVSSGHDEEALDSALSLRSSALMVGAAQLGKLTNDLIRLLGSGCPSVTAKRLAALKACGNQTAWQLTTSYIDPAPGAQL